MSGVTIHRPHPHGGDGLTTEQLDTVRGETHRRVCDDLERTVRERNVLADRVLALTARAVMAEEELAMALRRIERLMAERESP